MDLPYIHSHYGAGPQTTYHVQDQAAPGVDTHSTFFADIITQARIWLQTVRRTLYVQVLDKWNVPTNNPISVNQAFLLATRHRGLALRWQDIGVLVEGARADMVIFNGDSLGLLGWVDPVAAAVLHSHVGDIEHVLVKGRFVKRDGKLAVENYAGIQQRFLKSARRLQQLWKETPYLVLKGAFTDISDYENVEEADTLRGDGTGYGTNAL
jgi:hypothetical protein